MRVYVCVNTPIIEERRALTTEDGERRKTYRVDVTKEIGDLLDCMGLIWALPSRVYAFIYFSLLDFFPCIFPLEGILNVGRFYTALHTPFVLYACALCKWLGADCV